MPRIAELLAATTPRRPPAFDVADLVRRGRRRRRRAQLGTGMGAVALAVAVAAVAGLGPVAPGDQGQVVGTRPPIGEVAQAFAAAEGPIGTWKPLADPPFSPRMSAFTATASDGRVVVWGGSSSADGGGTAGGGTLTDGGVYDVENESWEAIPPAPLPSGTSFHWTQLTEDRLMVLASPDVVGGGGSQTARSPLVGAVYDLASGEWTEIESPPTITLPVEGVAWTGEVLALARFESGARFDVEAEFVEPVVERWSLHSGEWERGATPPLSQRYGPAVAFDGERLGVWGGAAQDLAHDGRSTTADLVGDGAIYDVAADRWESMPVSPLQPMMQGEAVWLDAGLTIAGGLVNAAESSMESDITGEPIISATGGAVFDTISQRWSRLPEPPHRRSDLSQGTFRIKVSEGFLTATDLRGSSPRPTLYYDQITRSWLLAPFSDLHSIDGTLVATTRSPDNPGDESFQVQVLAGSAWEPATEADFVNRMDAGVAVVGQDLFVVGGAQGSDLQVTGDAWLLSFDS